MNPDRMRIIHCFRSPVGGIFRHVRDLAAEQHRAGHDVGILCDSSTGGSFEDELFETIRPFLSLGLHRLPIDRSISFRDVPAFWRSYKEIRSLQPDVLHGHGAKGGAYARLAARRIADTGETRRPLAVYTPHGGSLHYAPDTLKGRVYMALERRLTGLTDALIFESRYSQAKFREQVGSMPPLTRVVPNGVLPAEFEPVAKAEAATTFLFVGELRRLKGVDLLIEALATANARQPVTLTVVGAGPDAAEFKDLAAARGIAGKVTFAGAMPARRAFSLGQFLVMPSRAESFPYIVLEAAAARLPIIATRVGGIPEITEGTDTPLVEPENVAALAAAMFDALAAPDGLKSRAETLQARVKAAFTVEAMTASVLDTYDAAAQRRAGELKLASA